ncbi:PREDICTED: uncharacterized protein LOC109473499 [Branchiostoma belcheri]|uniref:Uncharacterized protein LOC109473499 n=1 Tax=Branchiostoma belcheri TaxID=7741 RepID=A0A6P4ZCV2_BRABE|nr:PREDICTED: uncharacterized protein LOC109473499 [Branchiostoma belcheri]
MQFDDVKLRWLHPEDIYSITNRVLEDQSADMVKWEWIEDVAYRTWTRTIPEAKCVYREAPTMLYINNWEFVGLLNAWCIQDALWHSPLFNMALETKEEERYLRFIEFIYVFFHWQLRFIPSRTVSGTIASIALTGLTIPYSYREDTACIPPEDEAVFKRRQHFDTQIHLRLIGAVGRQDAPIKACEEKMRLLFGNVKRNSVRYNQRIGEKIEQVRRRYRMFPQFITAMITELMQENITMIPPHAALFNEDSIEAWSLAREEIIDRTFAPQNLLSSTFRNMTVTVKEDQILRLYGNMPYILKHFGHELSSDYLYYPENLGKLSERFEPQRIVTASSSHMPPFDLPHLIPHIKVTAAHLLEQAAMCTPTWYMWGPEQHVPSYYVTNSIQPSVDGAIETETPPCDMITYLKTKVCPEAGFMSEYINNKSHVKVLVFDIDRPQPLAVVDKALVESMGRDTISMTERIFEKIPEIGSGSAVHYVFWSDSGAELSKKIGLHHHIKLPPGIVMTINVARQLVELANNLRYMYPDTIGIDCDQNVYDPCIYPNADTPTGHGIRLPGQRKCDGKKPKVCVIRTDGLALSEPIPVTAMFVHAPDINEQGDPIVIGKVIDYVHDLLPMDDESFLRASNIDTLNNFTRNNCSADIQRIMASLNRHSVLFDQWGENGGDVEKLTKMVNELWILTGKKQMIEYAQSAVGHDNTTYPPHFIEQLNTSYFKVMQNRLTLVIPGMELRGGLPYCPRRPHRNKPKAPVSVHVIFNASMVRFGLSVSNCFKPTCRSKRLHTNVFLRMVDQFVSPSVRQEFDAEFLPQFNTKVDVYTIFFTKDEGHPIVDEELAEYVKMQPYSRYLTSSVDIAFLYAYEPTHHGVAILRTKNHDFVIMYKDPINDKMRPKVVATRVVGYMVLYLRQSSFLPNLQSQLKEHVIDIIENKDGQPINEL